VPIGAFHQEGLTTFSREKDPMRMPGPFMTKLAGAFLLVVVVLVGAATVSLWQFAGLAEKGQSIARQYTEEVVNAERLRSAQDAQAAAGRGYLITRHAEFLQRLQEAEDAFDQVLAALRSRIHSEEDSALLDAVAQTSAEYRRAGHRVLAEKGGSATAEEIPRQFERDVVPRRAEVTHAIDEFVVHKEKLLSTGYDEQRSLTRRAIATSAAVLSAAVLACAMFAWMMSRDLASAYRREQEAVRSAERALAARQELLGIVAHDLRSPLSAIAMKAGLLRRRADDENVRKQAESIGNVAMRMDLLIKSLLDAASIELGKLSVSRAPCDVDEVVHEAMDTLGSLATPKSIHLDVRASEAVTVVLADRQRLLQVLTNLVGNAIKFALEGGDVTIATERIGAEIRFSVSDTGPGIASEDLPHVFDRFWKAERGGRKGSGLGLYIAKGIVEAHGGRIWVDSQLGQGAKFYFTLAATEERPSHGEKPANGPSGSHPPVVHV
jgi:signal transduction histidine kinase